MYMYLPFVYIIHVQNVCLQKKKKNSETFVFYFSLVHYLFNGSRSVYMYIIYNIRVGTCEIEHFLINDIIQIKGQFKLNSQIRSRRCK